MSLNQVGACTGVLVLVGILYLHGCHRDKEPAKEPAKIVVAPAPKPVVVEKVVPVEPAKKADIPADKFPKDVPCIGDGKCGPRTGAPPPRKPVYHRVLKGGVVDGPMDCKHVPPVAKQYPPDVVLKYAKKLGLTEAQMNELRVCIQ